MFSPSGKSIKLKPLRILIFLLLQNIAFFSLNFGQWDHLKIIHPWKWRSANENVKAMCLYTTVEIDKNSVGFFILFFILMNFVDFGGLLYRVRVYIVSS